jgi:hypothetical protein
MLMGWEMGQDEVMGEGFNQRQQKRKELNTKLGDLTFALKYATLVIEMV